jgi:hypothetical protein
MSLAAARQQQASAAMMINMPKRYYESQRL